MRLPVNTVIHTTLVGLEPTTSRSLVRRATTQIDAACAIFRHQHLDIQGLQSPLLSQIGGLSPQRDRNCPVVQIHRLTIGHWLTSLRVPNPSQIDVLDSLRNPRLHLQQIRDQLMSMFPDCTPNLDWFVQFPTCSLQPCNSVDCGVFAIAFATDLCLGNDPASLRYIRRCHMRAHLLECLRLGFSGSWSSLTKSNCSATKLEFSCSLCRMLLEMTAGHI